MDRSCFRAGLKELLFFHLCAIWIGREPSNGQEERYAEVASLVAMGGSLV